MWHGEIIGVKNKKIQKIQKKFKKSIKKI